MKKEWSSSWNSSIQPRKQRKFRHNAPLHARQAFVRANLSPELRKRYSKRNLQLRKGDEIKVMRGSFRGKIGIVDKVDLKKSMIFVDEIKIKKVDGSEIQKGLEPSNLMITKLKLEDKKRQAILERREKSLASKAGPGKPEPKKAEPAPKPAKENESRPEKKPVKKAPAKKERKKQ